MEVLNIITNLISNVGFPIAMCLVLLFFVKKETESHKSEMEHITEALNNNTEAIKELRYEIKGKEVTRID